MRNCDTDQESGVAIWSCFQVNVFPLASFQGFLFDSLLNLKNATCQ